MSEKNAIAFITDQYYAGLTSVAITSLVKNNSSNSKYDVFILYNSLQNEDIDLLMALSAENVKINMISVDNRFEADYAQKNTPGCTLYKFLLYKLINAYDKILYCDSDTIFTNDISDIFDIELGEKYAGVVKDAHRVIFKNDNIRINTDTYFNTGVMLLNLKKMRKEDCFSQLMEIKNSINSPYVDQDVFNIYFKDSVVYLDWRFNYSSLNTRLDYKDLLFIHGEIVNPDEARIIHYTDGEIRANRAKFWNYETWEKYYKASPYTGEQVRHLKTDVKTASASTSKSATKSRLARACEKIFNSFYVPVKQEFVKYLDQKFEKTSNASSKEAGGIKERTILAKNDVLRFMSFLIRPVRPNSILLVEGASCHAETLPGYVTLFQSLGYNVDVVITEANYDLEPFSRLDRQGLSVFYGDVPTLKEILRLDKLAEYEHIFFNSRCLYMDMPHTKRPLFYEFFADIPRPKGKIISIEHHQEYLPHEFNDIMILDDLSPDNSLSGIEIHPYGIGDLKITPKNEKKVEFISIGNFESKRKDHPLLFQTVKKLVDSGRRNFHVQLIGRAGDDLKIPTQIADFVTINRKLKYTDCFDHMEKADFFLPLLNPEISGHLRYLKYGSTGSLQLIYSFAKPCIIHSTYGEKYHFTDKNSIQYNDNDIFFEAMIRAIEMPLDTYSEMQKSLQAIRDAKINQSLTNIRNILS